MTLRCSPSPIRSSSASLVLGVVLAAECWIGCGTRGGKAAESATTPDPAEQPIERVTGNPFDGVEIFYPPYTNADQARRRLEATNPEEAQLIAKIADTPQARWLGEWSGDVKTVAGNYAKAAHNKNKVALFVAYNVPNRDCGQYSAGGADGADAYRQWISGLAEGITASRRAIVILEPDALPQLTECLSEEDQALRLRLIKEAVETLSALPGVAVYVDAGHSRWQPAEVMAERLKAAGIAQARGFSLNVSNYIADDELIEYGKQLSDLLGGKVPFIIDSSRNGNGPTENAEWCNPEGRALGRRPTTDTGDERIDAFVWVKNPGESDGTCQGGPEAGQWFHERALEMSRNAKW